MNISGQSVDKISELLQVLADPAAFKEQIKTIQVMIDENKKFVELVAPAGELMNLLEKQRGREEAAEKAKDAAIAKAEKLVADAEVKAALLQANAQASADALQVQTQDALSQAQEALKEAAGQKAALAEVKRRSTELEKATAALAETQASLDVELANAVAATKAAETARQEFTAKLDKLKAL